MTAFREPDAAANRPPAAASAGEGTPLLVAVATYNERQTLPKLLQEIWRRLPRAEVLVVDDGSPDGTGQWCDDARAHEPRLHCLHRPARRGLGSAAAAAFRFAGQRGYPRVATIDADLSHDPAVLAEMLRRMEADPSIDAMIGSRYIAGGRIEGWTWRRRVASRWVNRLARAWLGLATRDNSGALQLLPHGRAPRRRYPPTRGARLRVPRGNPAPLAAPRGAQIEEIPIVFRDRAAGRSKLNTLESLRTLADLIRLRWTPPNQDDQNPN